jgi:hypothetical protein
MDHCEKCLGYITDRLSFPLHGHEPICQLIRHKNVRKHAWKIASFYSWAFQKNGEFPVKKVIEQSRVMVTIKHSKEILERKITGNAYLQENNAKILETFFHEYEKQFPDFGKEFEILVEFLYEWSVLPMRDNDTMKIGILWFIDWFCVFMEILPDLHREHSGGYLESQAVKKEVKKAVKKAAIVNPFSSPVPIRPQSATRVRIVMPSQETPPVVSTIPSDAIAITIKVPKYADDYVENWDDFMDQLYS